MNISIVLPIFNEDKIIEQSILIILKKSKLVLSNVEILAVNDGSTDKTKIILQKLQEQVKDVKIVTHKTNKGYGAALRSGIKHAKFDWVFFTDSDMQFDFSEISHFIPHTNEYDFIVGYRKKRADSTRRKIISFIYNRMVRILFDLPLKDVDCAFKLMRKSSLAKIDLASNSFFISVELMVKAKQKKNLIKELGVTHFPRRKGKSTVTMKRIVLSLIDLVKLRLSYL